MKKVLFPLIALVLALGLALPMAAPVAASPDTIWMIGSFDGSNTEFYVGSEDETGETAYTIGDPVVDFPRGLKHSSSGRTDCLYPESVTISFDTTVDYVNVNLRYSRMGGEENEVELDGSPLGTCAGPVDPNPATDYNFPVSGILSAGSHTVEITCTDGGNGPPDGAHYIDALELTGDPFVVTKELSASDGYLGDTITVTLDVENPSSDTLTVTDELPNGLKYIPGTFQVDGSPIIPTVADNTVSTTVGTGTHTITFDVQVVEVQCTNTTATNWAYLYYDEEPVAEDSEDITLHLYEGFEKSVEIVYEDGDWAGIVEVGELVTWNMTITVPNNFAWPITGAVLSDNLGGELGLAGDAVDNDRDKPKLDDEGDWGDLAPGYNTIPDGSLTVKTPGKSNKVHFWIKEIDITASDSLDFVLGIFTDRNPSKWGQQCYTSPCLHYLNSGATLKFTDPGTGFQLSAHTCPLPVYVTDGKLTLENKDTSDWSIIEDDTYGELYYSTEGDVFCYEFRGYGLEDGEDYSLIYYADFEDRMNVWGGNNPGALIATGTASGGNLTMSGSIDLGMDLPSPPDANISIHDYSGDPDYYTNAHGAKIWLVPTDCYDAGLKKVTTWSPGRFLFETDLIWYDDTNWP